MFGNYLKVLYEAIVLHCMLKVSCYILSNFLMFFFFYILVHIQWIHVKLLAKVLLMNCQFNMQNFAHFSD